jgi:hypothetical protein
MPWQLTTPVSTGDLDATNYGEISITEFRFSNSRELIFVTMQYGNTVDGEWVPGFTPVNKADSHVFDGGTFLSLVTTSTPDPGELTYVAVKRALFEQLFADGIIAPGTVV